MRRDYPPVRSVSSVARSQQNGAASERDCGSDGLCRRSNRITSDASQQAGAAIKSALSNESLRVVYGCARALLAIDVIARAESTQL